MDFKHEFTRLEMGRNFFWLAPLLVMGIGILPMPYEYYNLSRLVVCGCSLFFIFNLLKEKDILFAWIFGLLAVLYNPIVPIHLYQKELWMVVNAITAIIFCLKRHVVMRLN